MMKRPKLNRRYLKENVELYLILLPVLVFIFIFCYLPMYGIIIAFQDYLPGSSIFSLDSSVKWVGLEHFIDLFSSMFIYRALLNTLLLSVYGIGFGFWIPIAFAILLNELVNPRFKKVVQTVSYLPFFISAVVVAGIVLSFIDQHGLVNNIIALFGGKRVPLNITPSAFPVVYTLTNIWKSFGWNSILYLAAMSAIDPGLYEAAMIDGANRWHRILHITLPHMAPTASILLIFTVGGMLNSNTELILLMYNNAVLESADVIGTYVYRVGLLGGKFSFGAAAGIIVSVTNFLLLFVANKTSKRLTNYGVW